MDTNNKYRMGVNCSCDIPECTFCEKNDPTGERRRWRSSHFDMETLNRKTYDEQFLSTKEVIDGYLDAKHKEEKDV